MIKKFHHLLDSLEDKKLINLSLLESFRDKIEKGKLTKADDDVDHFCSFFVPVDRKNNSIFVGHHIKADEWIPPGGHIELGEMPLDTVRREFNEELSYELTDQKIEFFDISIMNVNSPTRPCRIHNDFWYAVHMKTMPDFKVDKGEFYDSSWLPIDQAIERAKRKQVTDSLSHLKLLLAHYAI